jgi:hypothetical protein
VYLLLIDTARLAELLVGAGATTVAGIGAAFARREDGSRIGVRPGMATGIPRAVLRAPADIVLVSLVAIRQLVRPREVRGEFCAVPFHSEEDPGRGAGRRALAESLGSFAPNTIVIGVDSQREQLLAHQLHRRGGRETLDPLGLG